MECRCMCATHSVAWRTSLDRASLLHNEQCVVVSPSSVLTVRTSVQRDHSRRALASWNRRRSRWTFLASWKLDGGFPWSRDHTDTRMVSFVDDFDLVLCSRSNVQCQFDSEQYFVVEHRVGIPPKHRTIRCWERNENGTYCKYHTQCQTDGEDAGD